MFYDTIIINYLLPFSIFNLSKYSNLIKCIFSTIQVSYEGEARYPDAPFGANNNNANQGYKY